ncbi:DUF6611 family protein [Leifsonia sp. RAF41]|uniref:DUF6611 family protein n=1 Tax=Leifsonia sp. RAF41 TaxID=3233056 RepID=UPI003F9CA7E0
MGTEVLTLSLRLAPLFAHTWPVAGAVLSLFGLVFLSDAGPVLSMATVLVAYVVGFAIAARLTRGLRSRSRSLTVASEYVGGELREFGDVHLLRVSTCLLMDLEARRKAGLVGPVAYEAEWAQVYDALPAEIAPTLRAASRR